MSTTEQDPLRDELTAIMYGADWRDTDVADAFKPDVEAAMKLIQLDRINQRMDEIATIPVEFGHYCTCTYVNDGKMQSLQSRYDDLESQKNQLTGGKDE